eukprot:jgi/Botrbrau1/10305/Bobra.0120s0020.1
MDTTKMDLNFDYNSEVGPMDERSLVPAYWASYGNRMRSHNLESFARSYTGPAIHDKQGGVLCNSTTDQIELKQPFPDMVVGSQEVESLLQSTLENPRHDVRAIRAEDLLVQFVRLHPQCKLWTVKDLEKRIRDAASKNLPAAQFFAGLHFCGQSQNQPRGLTDAKLLFDVQWLQRSLHSGKGTCVQEHALWVLAHLQGETLESVLKELSEDIRTKQNFFDEMDLHNVLTQIKKIFDIASPEAWLDDLKRISGTGFKRTAVFFQALCAAKGFGQKVNFRAANNFLQNPAVFLYPLTACLQTWIRKKCNAASAMRLVKCSVLPLPGAMETSRDDVKTSRDSELAKAFSSKLRVDAAEFICGKTYGSMKKPAIAIDMRPAVRSTDPKLPTFMEQMFPQEKQPPKQEKVEQPVKPNIPLLDRLCSSKDWQRLFECPSTLEIFKDPVVLSDGITYERKGAEEWLKGHNTSPSVGAELKSKKMIPNKYMLLLIKHGLAQRGLVED